MSVPNPAHPREITTSWLGEQLGFPIRNVHTEVTSEDRGFTGVIAVVTYYPEEGPSSSLIAKFPMAARDTESLVRKQAAVDEAAIRHHFLRSRHEIWTYEVLLPGSGISRPDLLCGITSEVSRTVILLLEHIRESRGGDVLAGCGVDDASEIVRELAKLHRHWWNLAPPTPQGRHWYRLDIYLGIEDRYVEILEPFLAFYGSRLPEELVAWMRTLVSSLPGVVDGLRRAPHTVIHADLHLDNILFRTSDGTPVVLDWQSAAYGPAVLDLALFLSNALTPTAFTESIDEILAIWLELVDPDRTYGVERLQQDFAGALTLLWCGGLRWLVNAARENVQGRERAMVDELLDNGRFINALTNLAIPRIRQGTYPGGYM